MARNVKPDSDQTSVNSNENLVVTGNRIPGRLDTVAMQQQTKYRSAGLTYISNDTDIVPRDEAGNVTLQEGAESNPLLIIDPVTEKVTTTSMLRVLDTRFQYYKFPVQVISSGSLDLNIDLNLNQTVEQDIIYARYKPSEDRIIATENSGILMDTVVEGVLQQNVNAYTITKDIKNLNRDLRFRIKIKHSYGLGNPPTNGTVYFYLYKNGPEMPEVDRTFNKTISGVDAYANILNYGTPQFSDDGYGEIYPTTSQELFLDLLIPADLYDIGDTFGIGAESGQVNLHTIEAAQTYWVITDATKNVDLWNQPIEE